MTQLSLAIPSKGRLKSQVEDWLTDCGAPVVFQGGSRGYSARVRGFPTIDLRLLSAGEIANALISGDIHIGVTGEDLLREATLNLEESVQLLAPLGFGRADLVVAVPESWVDVTSMSDLAAVAAVFRSEKGRRLRVATKYQNLAHDHFVRFGVFDHRIVESLSATEGAPAAGLAEVVVDITSSGQTLADNRLKIVEPVIFRSQAHLAASVKASWDEDTLATVRQLLRVVEARARAKGLVSLIWPAEQDSAAQQPTEVFVERGAARRANGLLANERDTFAIAQALADAGVGPVTAATPDYVFEPDCPAAKALADRVR
ncbi:MAG: ATP phosphoribosyltransferase [Parcubacteria group bacterium]